MDTRETSEELPEHRVLTDEVTGPVAVRRCDMVAEGQFVMDLEDNTVCPKCDIDAEEMTDNKIEENAVRPKSDMDAEAFDEVAKTCMENEKWSSSSKKRCMKLMMKFQRKMWRLEGSLKKEQTLPKVRNND